MTEVVVRDARPDDLDAFLPVFHEVVDDGETYSYPEGLDAEQVRDLWFTQPRRTSVAVDADPSQVLVTLGSQQGQALIAGELLGPGKRLAVEDPGYPDLWHIAVRAGASLVPLDVDGGGLVPTDTAA